MHDQEPTTAIPTPEPAVAPTATTPPPLQAPATESAYAAPLASPSVVRKPRGTGILNIALAGALVLAVAGVAFAVGRFTAPSLVSAGNFPGGGGQFFRNGQGGQGGANGQGNTGGQGGANGQGRGGFLGAGGLTLEGTVVSIDANTLTLKLASGQTIQIALGGSTTYHRQSDASASDVTAGGKVLVRLDGRGGFFGSGPQSTAGTAGGSATGPSASDITVVP